MVQRAKETSSASVFTRARPGDTGLRLERGPEEVTVQPIHIAVAVVDDHALNLSFVVEMTDGDPWRIPHPRLAINSGGAGFMGPDGGLVDFEFKKVRAMTRRVSMGLVCRLACTPTALVTHGLAVFEDLP